MTNEFLDANSKFREIASRNADFSNWSGGPDSRGWNVASQEWQKFFKKWREIDDGVFHPTPQVLDFDVPNEGPLCILIRKCYVKAEEVVWQRAASRSMGGVILSGQPGIGKTLFLWYLLVRLLRMKQPVLLHLTRTRSMLFWDSAVYSASSDVAALPTPLDKSFIWSLFDVMEPEGPPKIAISTRCFPVQAPSPSDVRYKIWRKERGPLFAAFPLWTREELAIAVRLDRRFRGFEEYLDKYWKNFLRGQDVPETSLYGPAVSLLRETPEVPNSTDKAFSILLDAMISRFGPIPRDVIFAMYDFRSHMELLDAALSVQLRELEETVQEIIRNRQFSKTTTSHCTVSVNPTGEIGDTQIWDIHFKSTYIKEQLSEQYIATSEHEVRSFIKRFSSVPQGKGLAGTLFESLVHRDITRGTQSWPFYKMRKSEGPESIKFIYDDSAAITDGFPKMPREQLKFFKRELPKQLASDQYYVPSEFNFPLIDSFLVDLDFAARSAHLWVLQMTTSEKHGGSKQGLVEIRKIIGTISKLFKKHDSDQASPAKKLKGPVGKPTASEGKLSIQVHYVLVCPDSHVQKGQEWELRGWNEGTGRADHRGDGYLLKFCL